MKLTHTITAVAALLCGAIACSDSSSAPEPEHATALAILAGNNQTGRVSFPVPTPLTVEVRNQHHLPMRSATVTFTTNNGGSFDSPTVYTDSDGVASVSYTLGTSRGTDTVFATVDGVTDPLVFTFTANPGPPTQLEEVGVTQETGTPGAQLATPFVIEVVDLFGNPIDGATVTWTTTGGTLSASTETTDADGKASVLLTMPSGGGTQTVTAHVENVADALFLATPVGG